MWILLLSKCKNNKRVRPCYRLYDILVRYDCANATRNRRGWVAELQQADTQTAANETESKTQTLNTQSSSLKVVRQIYLSSADAARSPIVVFDLEMSW